MKFRQLVTPLLLVVLVGLVFTYFFQDEVLSFIRGGSDNQNHEQVLLEIDLNLRNSRYQDAQSLINGNYRNSGTALTWLRYLKRQYQISRISGNFQIMSEISSQALLAFPGNNLLQEIHAYGLLRSQNYTEALGFLPNTDSERLILIRRESELETMGEELREGRLGLPGPQEVYSRLLMDPDPELYRRVAMVTGEAPVLQNTLLLYLQNGQMTEARNLLEFFPSMEESSMLSALMSYDSGDWSRSLEVLTRINEGARDNRSLMLQADIYHRLGRVEEAAQLYQLLVEYFPEESALPFLNLALIHEERNEWIQAKHFLERASEYHQDSEIDLFLAEAAFHTEDYPLYARLMEANSLEPRMQLLEMKLGVQENSLVRLWEFHRTHPDVEQGTEYLLWRNLVQRDFEGFDLALEDYLRHRNMEREKMSWWLYYYLALSQYLRGDLEGALASMDSLEEGRRTLDWYMSRALMAFPEMETTEYRDSSMENFNEALALLPLQGLTHRKLRSRILTYMGQINLIDDLPEMARRNWQTARELDNENWQASLYLRRLGEIRE